MRQKILNPAVLEQKRGKRQKPVAKLQNLLVRIPGHVKQFVPKLGQVGPQCVVHPLEVTRQGRVRPGCHAVVNHDGNHRTGRALLLQVGLPGVHQVAQQLKMRPLGPVTFMFQQQGHPNGLACPVVAFVHQIRPVFAEVFVHEGCVREFEGIRAQALPQRFGQQFVNQRRDDPAAGKTFLEKTVVQVVEGHAPKRRGRPLKWATV